jgi:hypothetical protein
MRSTEYCNEVKVPIDFGNVVAKRKDRKQNMKMSSTHDYHVVIKQGKHNYKQGLPSRPKKLSIALSQSVRALIPIKNICAEALKHLNIGPSLDVPKIV